MRPLFTTLTFLAILQGHAQSDLLKALGGMKVEEDNSPIVPKAFIGSTPSTCMRTVSDRIGNLRR